MYPDTGLINALGHEKQSITPDRTDMEGDFRAGDISANFVIGIEFAPGKPP